ncbi:YdcF family protein [Caballeronia sp. LZ062]|nr:MULTISPECIES: YdcF family protein [unclassified Caballeronia]MDR5854746.1 YdcF family protein [Caballeronia sp. LZ050]MDR5870725.1 YdcF family protein [Caballeronia sp. LZ062]
MLLFFALFVFCKRLRTAIVIVTLLLAWGLGAGWLTRPLLALAQRGYEQTIPPSFAPKTVIVLMGGGTARHHGELVPKRDSMPRIVAAARLYRQCRDTGASCRVILSGGDPQHHGQAEADNYAPYVLGQGVAPADLTRENRSLDTYQNARNVAGILGNAHDNALIVITSAYHMRRSLRAFEAFGYEPQPYVSDVRENRLTVIPRYRSLENGELALHELVGLARFHVWRWLHLY